MSVRSRVKVVSPTRTSRVGFATCLTRQPPRPFDGSFGVSDSVTWQAGNLACTSVAIPGLDRATLLGLVGLPVVVTGRGWVTT